MGQVYTVAFRNKEFKINTTGSARPEWLYQSFVFEQPQRNDWWTIQEGDIVFDVGAGYGSWTLPALASGASVVVAFEPGKAEYFDLCGNLVINGWFLRTLALPFLAGEKLTLQGTYYPQSHSGVSPSGPAEERMTTAVDDIVFGYSMKRLDWIKIDVEGAELSVLKGCERALAHFHPTLVIENHIEIVHGIEKDIKRLLKPKGYVEEKWQDINCKSCTWSKWVWKEKKKIKK